MGVALFLLALPLRASDHADSISLPRSDHAFPMLEALCCNGSDKDRVALTLGLLRQGLSDPDWTTEVKQSYSLWRRYLEQKQRS
jgi:hypothetical protein